MDADVLFINAILLVTSASNMPSIHSICHFRFFCYWIGGRDHFKNDLKKIKDGPKSKINLETKPKNSPKRRDQKCTYVRKKIQVYNPLA